MRHLYKRLMIFAALPILFIIAGCAGHGKLVLPPANETDDVLAHLLSQSDQYLVHYHGYSNRLVSGLLFDPKEDDKRIQPQGAMWQETSDKEEIASIANIILGAKYPSYFPIVYRITGPNGNFYGYLVTGWTHLTIQSVDDQTLRVFGLSGPPEYMTMDPSSI